jgi:hypothetical protein
VDQIIKDTNGPLVHGQLAPQVHTSLLIEWGLDRRYDVFDLDRYPKLPETR